MRRSEIDIGGPPPDINEQKAEPSGKGILKFSADFEVGLRCKLDPVLKARPVSWVHPKPRTSLSTIVEPVVSELAPLNGGR